MRPIHLPMEETAIHILLYHLWFVSSSLLWGLFMNVASNKMRIEWSELWITVHRFRYNFFFVQLVCSKG